MKVQLLGHYYPADQNNMGDEAIHRQVMADIREIDPGIQFVNEVGPPDVFILGGGGMYSDWQPEAFDTWLPPIKWAQKNNIPVVAYGIGVGPLFTDTGKRRLKEVFDKIDLIMVRDWFSKGQLTQIGIKDVVVTGDPAVRYDLKPLKIGFNVVNIPAIKGLRPFLSVAGRVLQEYGQVDVCCFWEPHRKFCQEVFDGMMAPAVMLDLRNPVSAADTIRKYDYWVGMQLHGLILAVSRGVRGIALSYHLKCCAFVQAARPMLSQVLIADGRNIPFGVAKSGELRSDMSDLYGCLSDFRAIVNRDLAFHNRLRDGSQKNLVKLKKFLLERGLLK